MSKFLPVKMITNAIATAACISLTLCGPGSSFFMKLSWTGKAHADSGVPIPTSRYQSEPNISESDPRLAKYYHQQIKWHPCFTRGSEFLECGYFAVPVDYEHPEGDQENLFVFNAQSTKNTLAHVIINPGGPGEPGVETMITYADHWHDTVYGEHLNMVSFDTRGSGFSRPQSVCETDQQKDADRQTPAVRNDAAGILFAEKQEKDLMDLCVKKLGANYLRHIGTADTVKDMDVLRAILGDKKLSYIGFSYGTFLGTQYAEQFPHKVRAMVLDGVVDPSQNSGDAILKQTAAREQVFLDFARDCINKEKQQCPLGTDPTQAALDRKVQNLVRKYNFVPIMVGGRKVYSSDIYTGIGDALYNPESWPTLRKAFAQLNHGNAEIFLALADDYLGRDEHGHYGPFNENFFMVHCADAPPDSQETLNNLDTQARKTAPYEDDGLGTGKAPLQACSFWPVPYSLRPHSPNISQDVQFLVFSTTHDPATPYAAGVNLARQINGVLVTVHASKHTAVFANTCADLLTQSYLIYGNLPKTGAQCPAR